jgi:AraC-like DNA-binding protein
VFPDGCIELIVHLGDPFERWSGGRAEPQPRCMLVGQLTKVLELRPAARIATMGIRFRPGGAAAFFHLPLHEVTDRSVPLASLWGAAGRRFEQAVCDSTDDRVRRRRAESALVARLDVRAETQHVVAAAVAEVLRRGGQLRVSALAQAAGWSPRRLERRFKDAVGLSPKALARIVRFQSVFSRLAPAPPEWAALALDCGYYDQSHLVREFQALAGDAPTRLRAAENGLARHFTSPERMARFFGEQGE